MLRCSKETGKSPWAKMIQFVVTRNNVGVNNCSTYEAEICKEDLAAYLAPVK